ncbi:MAG: hypothetical protein CMJ59_13750 [Planctomycetaceae bacterium]|nr:hypothetical protein [Planctomycetaceae bacterium]
MPFHNPYLPRVSRRSLLTAAGPPLLGLSASPWADLQRVAAQQRRAGEKPARSCVLFFLFGGPSQIDLWDMKPTAPVEIRGDFQPIATSVPGIHVCEHLPQLAQRMDKICLLRSMTHNMNVHGPACSEVFSGREYFGAPTTDQANEQDWPSTSSMVMRYGESRGGFPASVVLPWYLQFPGQARRIAGQTGARMGERHNAMLVQGDDEAARFHVDGLQLRQTIPRERIRHRGRLLDQFLIQAGSNGWAGKPIGGWRRHRDRAQTLVERRAGQLLNIERETTQTRERYGSTMVGQSLLMARRLVEADIPLVTVNWVDETKIDGINTCWDTHQENFPKLKNLLCPMFDQSFSAFIEDLDQRGLLETTLVVALGEFGRTPHMGQFSQSSNTLKTGRDHWPSAFTALLAGGGVRGGQIYGATNAHAAFVADKPVSPADLVATILDHLGIDHRQQYVDELQGLRHALSPGRPLRDLG